MKLLLFLVASLSLYGCSLLGGKRPNRDTEQEDGGVNQVGLLNVNSGNTYNFPPPSTTRFKLEQRLDVNPNVRR